MRVSYAAADEGVRRTSETRPSAASATRATFMGVRSMPNNEEDFAAFDPVRSKGSAAR
jgi:hypothetical protein